MAVDEKQNLPIDRGWAWVVCAACFVEIFLFGGVVKSFGLFFVEYLEAFDTSASSVSLILSVQSVVASVIGLLSMTVGPMFCSHRCLTIIGGLSVSAGYLVNAFAPNILVVLMGTGVIFGFGSAFTHGPATVMVGKYFERRRGFANGMFKVGAGLGSFAFPQILRYLLDTYGLQGTLLLVAGLLLNIIPCGALLRPMEFYQRNNVKRDSAEEEKEDLLSESYLNGKTINIAMPEIDTIKKCDLFPFASSDHIHTNQNSEPRKRTLTVSEYTVGNGNISNNRRLYSGNILDALSTNSVAMYGSVEGVVGHLCGSSKLHTKSKTITDDHTADGGHKRFKNLNMKKIFKSIFDKQLIQNKLMLLYLTSTALSITGIGFMNSYIPPHAKDMGIDDQDIAILISIFGGADLVGRFLMALIADIPFIKRSVLCALSVLIAGGCCQLIPLFTSFWTLAVFSGVTGLCAGFYFAVTSVVLIDFVGIHNLSKAYGISQVTNGIAVTSTTPLLGVIRDKTSTYIGSFYLLGGCLLVSGFLLFLEPLVRKWQKKRSGEDHFDQTE